MAMPKRTSMMMLKWNDPKSNLFATAYGGSLDRVITFTSTVFGSREPDRPMPEKTKSALPGAPIYRRVARIGGKWCLCDAHREQEDGIVWLEPIFVVAGVLAAMLPFSVLVYTIGFYSRRTFERLRRKTAGSFLKAKRIHGGATSWLGDLVAVFSVFTLLLAAAGLAWHALLELLT